jgi:amino acid adenylation domain-containing protein
MSNNNTHTILTKKVNHNPFLSGEIIAIGETTESQKEMWAAIDNSSEHSLCYNESVRIELNGKLNLELLQRAYQEVIRRHDSLRMTFSKDGKHFQVSDKFDYQIFFINEKQNSLEDVIKNETLVKFDLLFGPLIQAKVFRIDERKHILFLTAHHIICDGWSLAVIINELSVIYSSLIKKESLKVEWPEQFLKYSNNEKSRGINQKDEDYWLNQFSQNIPLMDLPLDFPRPDSRSIKSDRIDYEINKDLIIKLKKIGAQNGASFYSTLMSIFEILVSKILNQNELVIGISAAGQSIHGAEKLVGHLVNLLPIRCKINSNDSYKDFLKYFKTVMLDAFDHQQITFGSLLKKLKIQRDAAKLPLINIIFNVDQQYPGQGLEFWEIDANYQSNPRHAENFEIFINATSCGDKVVLECQYCSDLFSQGTIKNWLIQFEKIILLVCENPDLSLNSLKLNELIIPKIKEQKYKDKKIIQITNSSEEQLIAQIWRDVLQTDKIAHDANFFFLGGHSILGLDLLSKIEKSTGIKLTLKHLFEAPTIAEMAIKIKGTQQITKDSVLVGGESQGKRISDLSMNQMRTWYLEQLNPHTSMHNLPSSIRLKTKIDLGLLSKTLNYLIDRHESLRTCIEVENGKPIQRIKDAKTINYILHEEKVSEKELLTKLSEEADHVFNLASCPLFTAKLFKISENDYVFFFMVHHIIWDGWCFDIFFEELNTIYSSLAQNGDPRFSRNPKISYFDFCHWQKDFLNGENAKKQISFWKNNLSLPLPVLEIPTDFKRPQTMTHFGKSVPFIISEKLHKDLFDFSKNHHLSLYTVFLTSYKIALSFYSDQNDLIVGTPVRGRPVEDLNSTIGYFVNTVALRSSIDLNETFNNLLKKVEKTCFEAFDNQDVPFEKILNAIPWERDNSRTPIYQTFFSYQDVSNRKAELNGQPYTQINVDKFSTHTDLDLWIKTNKSKIEGAFEFRTDIFKEENIHNFCEIFINILEQLTKNPFQRINKNDLIPDTQKKRLLIDWNQTKVNLDLNKSIIDYFKEQVEAYPQKIAVENENEQISYKELDEKSNIIANFLISQGIKSSDLVGLSLHRNPIMLAALLGVLKSGAGYVPLDPYFPQDRLDYMVEASGLKLMIGETELKSRFQNNVPFYSLDVILNTNSNSQLNNRNILLNSVAYVIYTSGSTGQPKGVQISHKAMINFLLSMKTAPSLDLQSKLLAVTTLSFDIAVLELYLPLIAGGTVYIAAKEQTMDGEALLNIIQEKRINIMQATPSTWRLLIAAGWKKTPHFKVLCGGENFPKDLANKLLNLADEVWNMYGPTETTVWSTCKKLSLADQSISIGKPINNTTIYILDDNLNLVPIGKPGNLYIGGEGLADGYRHRPDLTEQRFIKNPFNINEVIYNTGDIARYEMDGSIECLGRNDGQIKIRGFRIELGEIESVLSKFEKIVEAVVITRELIPNDLRIIAYYISQNNVEIDQNILRTYLSEKLPHYMIPNHFVKLNEFPKTLNQKIDKKNLPNPYIEKENITLSQSNDISSPIYLKIKKIWCEILNVKDISPDDNFFKLGGHSLLSIDLFAKISSEFKVNLPLATLFSSGTLSEFSHLIESKLDAKNLVIKSENQTVNFHMKFHSVVPIKANGSKTPIFIFHGVGGNVLNYARLVGFVEPDQPFYGVQSFGVDGESEPIEGISQMAKAYINEMKLFKPYGPYILAGGSMGGMIAFEVARQLIEIGDSVEKIIMFDTFGPNLELKNYNSEKKNYLKTYFNSFKYKVKKTYSKFRYFLHKYMSVPISNNLRFFYIENLNYQSLWNYKAQSININLHLIRAHIEKDGWYSDPDMGWKNIIQGKIFKYFIKSSHENFIESPELGPMFKKVLNENN